MMMQHIGGAPRVSCCEFLGHGLVQILGHCAEIGPSAQISVLICGAMYSGVSDFAWCLRGVFSKVGSCRFEQDLQH